MVIVVLSAFIAYTVLAQQTFRTQYSGTFGDVLPGSRPDRCLMLASSISAL
jgi:hypothetical protein